MGNNRKEFLLANPVISSYRLKAICPFPFPLSLAIKECGVNSFLKGMFRIPQIHELWVKITPDGLLVFGAMPLFIGGKEQALVYQSKFKHAMFGPRQIVGISPFSPCGDATDGQDTPPLAAVSHLRSDSASILLPLALVFGQVFEE